MFGVECVTTEQAMVVSFLDTTTIFTVVPGYEVGLCAMYPRHLPVNRYFAKPWSLKVEEVTLTRLQWTISLISRTSATKRANATTT